MRADPMTDRLNEIADELQQAYERQRQLCDWISDNVRTIDALEAEEKEIEAMR